MYVDAFNFEALVVKPPSDKRVERLLATSGPNSLGAAEDILRAAQQSDLRIALREGWSPLSGTRTFENSASIDLLNTADEPLHVVIALTFAAAVNLEVIVDERRVAYSTGAIGKAEFSVLPGGHEVILFAGASRTVEVQAIHVEAAPATCEDHNLQLPFDQFQRYHSLGKVIDLLRARPGAPLRILDVGGSPGQILGFLPHDDVRVVDVQRFDSPRSFLANGLALPFADATFDVVTSVDVLEHVHADDRQKFLEELLRVTRGQTIVAGPYHSPAVVRAEEILFDYIKERTHIEHRYLGEHSRFGLPHAADVSNVLRALGAREVLSIPNIPLDVWLLIMGAYFCLDADPRFTRACRLLSRFLNEQRDNLETSEHSYRRICIASKASFTDHQRQTIQRLLQDPAGQPDDFSQALKVLDRFTLEIQDELKHEFEQELNRYKEQAQRMVSEIDQLSRQPNESRAQLEREASQKDAELRQQVSNRQAQGIDALKSRIGRLLRLIGRQTGS